jgi:hypothetical protein
LKALKKQESSEKTSEEVREREKLSSLSLRGRRGSS